MGTDSSASATPFPPEAARRPTIVASVFGRDVVNDYEWLRDPDDPDVLAYLDAENVYADRVTAPTLRLQHRLISEFTSRATTLIGEGLPLPVVKGPYEFFGLAGDDDLPIVHRRRVDDPSAGSEPVLDASQIMASSAYVRLQLLEPSDDGERLAYSVDLLGSERFTLQVKDLRTGSTLVRDRVHVDSAAWSADGETLFYAEVGERPFGGQRLWSLRVSTGDRTLLHDELDRSFYVSVRRSADGELIFMDLVRTVGVPQGSAQESRTISAVEAGSRLTPIIERGRGWRFRAEHANGSLFIRLDDEGPYGRIVRTTLDRPDRDLWEEVLPHRVGVTIDDFKVIGDHLVLTEWEAARCHIRVIGLSSGETYRIPMPEPAYDLDLIGPGPEPDSSHIRYAYSSCVTPPMIVDHDTRSRTSAVLSQQLVDGHDATRYEIRRLVASAQDRTAIPVTIVRRKDLTGSASGSPGPVVLWGYGCYGIVLSEGFEAERLSLLDRGVTVALAHPRGGGELGRPWHDAGRAIEKRTTWTDFVSVAEHLILSGVADPARVVIVGASAGGALVTAAANLRHDLFRAVVALVPFTDPLHVQLDATMPFTIYERDEWGDPRASEEEFVTLKAHCPFTNIREGGYPVMYVTAAMHDGQVPYWQPAKYVARLRHLRTDDNRLILRTNLCAGHLGSSRPREVRAEVAEWYAFILDQLELDGDTGSNVVRADR